LPRSLVGNLRENPTIAVPKRTHNLRGSINTHAIQSIDVDLTESFNEWGCPSDDDSDDDSMVVTATVTTAAVVTATVTTKRWKEFWNVSDL
jgi:predicted amino acid dehydrogenase